MSGMNPIYDLLAKADLIDEVSSTEFYFGWAAPGAPATSAAKFAICHMVKNGNVWTRKWVQGNKDQIFIWDDRAAYTYSFVK